MAAKDLSALVTTTPDGGERRIVVADLRNCSPSRTGIIMRGDEPRPSDRAEAA